MTPLDIERMAREAHRQLVTQDYPGHLGQVDPWTMCLLTRFAALVRAQALEDAARVCESLFDPDDDTCNEAEACAAAIRALASDPKPHRVKQWGHCSVCRHDRIPGEGCARKDCPDAPASDPKGVT